MDSFGYDFLQELVQNSSEGTVKLLLEKGANPNRQNSQNSQNGQISLHIAARHGDRKATELLLSHGADPTINAEYGRTPLYMAGLGGNMDVIQMLFNTVASRHSMEYRDAVMEKGGILVKAITGLFTTSIIQLLHSPDTPTKYSATIETLDSLSDSLNDKAPKDPNFPPVVSNRTLHYAICDGCDLVGLSLSTLLLIANHSQYIYGPRKKRKVCDIFNSCFKRISTAPASHPDHSFDGVLLHEVPDAERYLAEVDIFISRPEKELGWL